MAVDCSELAKALGKLHRLTAEREDIHSYDDVVRSIQSELRVEGMPDLSREEITQAVEIYRRYLNEISPKEAMSKVARINAEAKIEGALGHERLAGKQDDYHAKINDALDRLAAQEAKPRTRRKAVIVNDTIKELRTIAAHLTDREMQLRREKEIEAQAAGGEIPAAARKEGPVTREKARADEARERLNEKKTLQAVDADIAALEKRIDSGDLSKADVKARARASEELSARRAARQVLKDEISARRAKADLEEQLTTGKRAAPAARREGPQTLTRNQIEELRGRIAAEDATAQRQARLEDQIRVAEEQLASGQYPATPGRREGPRGELESRLTDLRGQLATAKADQRAEDATARKIAEAQQAIAEGDLAIKSGKPTAPTSDSMRAKKDMLESLRKQLATMRVRAELEHYRLTGELPARRAKKQGAATQAAAELSQARGELRREETLASLEQAIGELTDKLNAGIFEPKPKRPERSIDQEVEDARFDLHRLRVRNEAAVQAQKGKTLGQRIRAPFAFLTNLASTGDFSAVTRQGGKVLVSHPMLAGATFVKEGVQAFASERRSFGVTEKRKEHPRYRMWLRAGLREADTMNKAEENIRSSFLDKVGGFSNYNRFHREYLNSLRFNYANMIADVYYNGEIDAEQAKDIARFVNAATGQSEIRAPQFIGDLGFAPNYSISNIEMVLGVPIWKANGRQMKTALAREMVRMVLGYILAATGLALAGIAVGKDPRASNFLKAVKGKMHADFMGGVSQWLILAARLSAFAYRTEERMRGAPGANLINPVVDAQGNPSAKQAGAVVGSFLRSKASPGASIAADIFTGNTFRGTSEKTTAQTMLRDHFGPIPVSDTYQIMTSEMSIPAKAAMFMLSQFGIGLSFYDDSQSSKQAQSSALRQSFGADVDDLVREYGVLEREGDARTDDQNQRFETLKGFNRNYLKSREAVKRAEELGQPERADRERQRLADRARTLQSLVGN